MKETSTRRYEPGYHFRKQGRPLRSLLSLLLAGCATEAPDSAPNAEPDDTAAADSAAVECDILAAEAVNPGSVTVDWSTWSPSDETILYVVTSDAESTLDVACAGALTIDLLVEGVRVAASESSAEVALSAYDGMSLVISVTDADGLHGWVAPIQAGGTSALSL